MQRIILQSFKLVLKSIWGNRIRSFLTVLGIIIGVAAVIMPASPVNGYMGSVVESFAGMGVNQINVNVTNPTSRFLDVDQVYTFYEEHTDLFGELSPNVTLFSTIKYGDGSITSTPVAGRSEQYLEIRSYELGAGRSIACSDIVSHQKVCVIDAYVVNELYRSAQNAIEQTLKIDGYALRMIGATKAQDEDSMEDGGTNDFVWIPYSVAVRMPGNADINNYIFTALGTSRAGECTTVIRNFLYEISKDEDLYRVTAVSKMSDSLDERIAMMSGILGGITGTPLLMADVSVTNIIPVSVTERTRETGVRKSLGADEGTIMRQFVVEAAMTSSMGGVIGILAGCVATTVVGAAVGASAIPTLSAVVISLSVSVGIRLLFGYMPASRAASLNPIDALRSE